MTRPKKWYLEENLADGPEARNTEAGIVIKNAQGLLKKPNASQPLGRGCSVSVAEAQADSVLVGGMGYFVVCTGL